MIHRNRVPSWRKILNVALALTAVAGVACAPTAPEAPRLAITAEALDRIDAAVDELARERWPSWTMEVAGSRLTFRVEVAGASAAEACNGIGEAVRGAAGDIAWSADLTRDGQPLASCGTVDMLARERGAGPRDA